MSKLLTISIAAYNVEKTIEKCLDSFLPCKHLSDLEILVINDGSKDCTAEIVSRYEKHYPGIIKLVNNENAAHRSTINKTLSQATRNIMLLMEMTGWIRWNWISSVFALNLQMRNWSLMITWKCIQIINAVYRYAMDMLQGKFMHLVICW